MQGRRFNQLLPLNHRLVHESNRLREKATNTPPGHERERLIRLARQAKTASYISEWLSSPGLRAPI